MSTYTLLKTKKALVQAYDKYLNDDDLIRWEATENPLLNVTKIYEKEKQEHTKTVFKRAKTGVKAKVNKKAGQARKRSHEGASGGKMRTVRTGTGKYGSKPLLVKKTHGNTMEFRKPGLDMLDALSPIMGARKTWGVSGLYAKKTGRGKVRFVAYKGRGNHKI